MGKLELSHITGENVSFFRGKFSKVLEFKMCAPCDPAVPLREISPIDMFMHLLEKRTRTKVYE